MTPMIKTTLKLLTVVLIAIFIGSCSKDSMNIIPEPKSDANELITFSINRSSNPSLSSDCNSFVSGGNIYLSVPEGVSLTSLKPTITVSPKATISINGVPYTNNSTSIDFTNTASITITSESGKSKSFMALVQSGRATLDNLILAFMKKFDIPGVSFAISKDEQIVYSVGLGFAIKESATRVKPDMLFRLASISKQFTSLCILKLYEAGKIDLDRNVFGAGGILQNEFPNTAPMASLVTIRHLLSNTSGWSNNPDPMFTSTFYGQTLDQRINFVLTELQKNQVTPGTKYSYFNMGFGILGKVIEKVSGKSYETYMKEVLLQAGINDIHIGGDRSQKRPNEVVYYSQSGTNGYGNEMQVIAAAGGVIASAPQMLKLLAHMDGNTKVPDIITPQTRSMMLTPSAANNRYALGWMVNHSLFFQNCCYHTGNLAGTAVMWVMGNGMNTVVLCNSRSYIESFDNELYELQNNLRLAASNMSW